MQDPQNDGASGEDGCGMGRREMHELVARQTALQLEARLIYMSPERAPRPPNAFMLFAITWRRRIAAAFPSERNSSISVRLGTHWKSLPQEQKEAYYTVAHELEVEHSKQFPGYVYSPLEARQRKAKRAQLRNRKPSGVIPKCNSSMLKGRGEGAAGGGRMLQSYGDVVSEPLGYYHQIAMPPAAHTPEYSISTPPWYNTHTQGGVGGGEEYYRGKTPEWTTSAYQDSSDPPPAHYVPPTPDNSVCSSSTEGPYHGLVEGLALEGQSMLLGGLTESSPPAPILPPNPPTPADSLLSLKDGDSLGKLDQKLGKLEEGTKKLPGFHQTFGTITEIGRFSQHDDYFETRPDEAVAPVKEDLGVEDASLRLKWSQENHTEILDKLEASPPEKLIIPLTPTLEKELQEGVTEVADKSTIEISNESKMLQDNEDDSCKDPRNSSLATSTNSQQQQTPTTFSLSANSKIPSQKLLNPADSSSSSGLQQSLNNKEVVLKDSKRNAILPNPVNSKIFPGESSRDNGINEKPASLNLSSKILFVPQHNKLEKHLCQENNENKSVCEKKIESPILLSHNMGSSNEIVYLPDNLANNQSNSVNFKGQMRGLDDVTNLLSLPSRKGHTQHTTQLDQRKLIKINDTSRIVQERANKNMTHLNDLYINNSAKELSNLPKPLTYPHQIYIKPSRTDKCLKTRGLISKNKTQDLYDSSLGTRKVFRQKAYFIMRKSLQDKSQNQMSSQNVNPSQSKPCNTKLIGHSETLQNPNNYQSKSEIEQVNYNLSLQSNVDIQQKMNSKKLPSHPYNSEISLTPTCSKTSAELERMELTYNPDLMCKKLQCHPDMRVTIFNNQTLTEKQKIRYVPNLSINVDSQIGMNYNKLKSYLTTSDVKVNPKSVGQKIDYSDTYLEMNDKHYQGHATTSAKLNLPCKQLKSDVEKTDYMDTSLKLNDTNLQSHQTTRDVKLNLLRNQFTSGGEQINYVDRHLNINNKKLLSHSSLPDTKPKNLSYQTKPKIEKQMILEPKLLINDQELENTSLIYDSALASLQRYKSNIETDKSGYGPKLLMDVESQFAVDDDKMLYHGSEPGIQPPSTYVPSKTEQNQKEVTSKLSNNHYDHPETNDTDNKFISFTKNKFVSPWTKSFDGKIDKFSDNYTQVSTNFSKSYTSCPPGQVFVKSSHNMQIKAGKIYNKLTKTDIIDANSSGVSMAYPTKSINNNFHEPSVSIKTYNYLRNHSSSEQHRLNEETAHDNLMIVKGKNSSSLSDKSSTSQKTLYGAQLKQLTSPSERLSFKKKIDVLQSNNNKHLLVKRLSGKPSFLLRMDTQTNSLNKISQSAFHNTNNQGNEYKKNLNQIMNSQMNFQSVPPGQKDISAVSQVSRRSFQIDKDTVEGNLPDSKCALSFGSREYQSDISPDSGYENPPDLLGKKDFQRNTSRLNDNKKDMHVDKIRTIHKPMTSYTCSSGNTTNNQTEFWKRIHHKQPVYFFSTQEEQIPFLEKNGPAEKKYTENTNSLKEFSKPFHERTNLKSNVPHKLDKSFQISMDSDSLLSYLARRDKIKAKRIDKTTGTSDIEDTKCSQKSLPQEISPSVIEGTDSKPKLFQLCETETLIQNPSDFNKVRHAADKNVSEDLERQMPKEESNSFKQLNNIKDSFLENTNVISESDGLLTDQCQNYICSSEIKENILNTGQSDQIAIQAELKRSNY